jgi:hypothetical protein
MSNPIANKTQNKRNEEQKLPKQKKQLSSKTNKETNSQNKHKTNTHPEGKTNQKQIQNKTKTLQQAWNN